MPGECMYLALINIKHYITKQIMCKPTFCSRQKLPRINTKFVTSDPGKCAENTWWKKTIYDVFVWKMFCLFSSGHLGHCFDREAPLVLRNVSKCLFFENLNSSAKFIFYDDIIWMFHNETIETPYFKVALIVMSLHDW